MRNSAAQQLLRDDQMISLVEQSFFKIFRNMLILFKCLVRVSTAIFKGKSFSKKSFEQGCNLVVTRGGAA